MDLQSFAYLESESELPDATEISDPSLPKVIAQLVVQLVDNHPIE